jgi:hypothetical protein
MFIVHESWKIIHRSVRSETMVSEEHISLRWSEAVLSRHLSINISPLCGEGKDY